MCHADKDTIVPNHQRFDSEVVRSMSVAYANVCRALGLSTKPDPARKCGGPLHGRDGQFIVKYFLVDRPRRRALGARGG